MKFFLYFLNCLSAILGAIFVDSQISHHFGKLIQPICWPWSMNHKTNQIIYGEKKEFLFMQPKIIVWKSYNMLLFTFLLWIVELLFIGLCNINLYWMIFEPITGPKMFTANGMVNHEPRIVYSEKMLDWTVLLFCLNFYQKLSYPLLIL